MRIMCTNVRGTNGLWCNWFYKSRPGQGITTPFDMTTDKCRRCGGCIYICPVCMLRCQGKEVPSALCGNCYSLQPTCTDYYDDAQCFMYDTECGTCVRGPRATGSKDKEKAEVKNEK